MANQKLKRLTATALCAALCVVATTFLRIPTALGYVNLGDAFVLLSGMLLGPLGGAAAGGIGSGLADLFGYPQYAPVTLVIKAMMALLAAWAAKLADGKRPAAAIVIRLTGGLLAEAVMVGGYLAYESVLYGLGAAVVSVPFNALQGAVGILLASVVYPLVKKPFARLK
ncbi:MAG: ECF transporter S component [Clostridia bacterium]|nr:ECF transporter S component [Clostridia bacterium]